MKESEGKFLPPCPPYIIVSKLTKEIIIEALEAFLNDEKDAYWVKFYSITAGLEIDVLNELLDRQKKEDMEMEAKLDAEYGPDEEDYS